MKADTQRMRSALAKPGSDCRLYLLHGPDEAGARALADTIGPALGPEAERVDLPPAALKTNPGLLADEAASLSLFGTARHIRVLGAGEEVLEALTLLLAADRAGNPVVVLAPGLRTTAKVVKLALESRQALACACYEPSGAEIDRIVADLARAHGLHADTVVIRRLAEATGNDRSLIVQEIEKIALYLDAAPDRTRHLSEEALDAIGADLSDGDADAFAAAVTAGDVAETGNLVAVLAESGQSAIAWLRAMTRRLLLLAEMQHGGGSGRRAPFGQEAELRAAMSRWSADRIAAALDMARSAERAIMASGTAGDVVARACVLDIARRAARR